MPLTLELTASIEQELAATAARDGVTPDVLAVRLLKSALRQNAREQRRAEMEAAAAAAFAASGETEEEMEAYIAATVKQVRAEIAARDAEP
jgi:hypothetical protein